MPGILNLVTGVMVQTAFALLKELQGRLMPKHVQHEIGRYWQNTCLCHFLKFLKCSTETWISCLYNYLAPYWLLLSLDTICCIWQCWNQRLSIRNIS
jgi:hypothetical protein